MARTISLFALALLFCLALISGVAPVSVGRSLVPTDGTEPLPPGASIETLLPNMDKPVAMAFDPQGRLFYTEKVTGKVRLYANGVLQSNAVITFAVDSTAEHGLLGIAVDPNFNANRYIYVYYTCGGCPTLENRVVRFTESNGTGSNAVTIFTSPQTAGNHVGGNIHFGSDGKLYISIGDNDIPANSQNANARQGKIHRINPDGSIPGDNPVFTPPGVVTATYALGLRNSFDFTFDPLTPGRIFASENGPGCDDEMNRIERGYNYGWRPNYPCDDGSPSPAYNDIPPLWYIPRGECCEAPTGITFYTGYIGQWRNHLFMASYNTGTLRHFYLNGGRTSVTTTNRVQGVNANMDIETGPDGALWYLEGGGYSQGTLKRIVSNTCRTQFDDVPFEDTFYPSIRCLACRSIISGYADGTFRPNAAVTRGQLAKIVSNAAGFTESPDPQMFEDVPPTDTFYQWINRLARRGHMSGYPCGGTGEPCTTGRPYFRPNANATRGQTAKIVANAAGFNEPATGQMFQDVPATHSFYTWVQRLASRNIMQGYPCGGPGEPCIAGRPYFRPSNDVTRGQSTKIVANAFYPNCVTP